MDGVVGPTCLDDYAKAPARRTNTLEPEDDDVPSIRCETPNRSNHSRQLIKHLWVDFADRGRHPN